MISDGEVDRRSSMKSEEETGDRSLHRTSHPHAFRLVLLHPHTPLYDHNSHSIDLLLPQVTLPRSPPLSCVPLPSPTTFYDPLFISLSPFWTLAYLLRPSSTSKHLPPPGALVARAATDSSSDAFTWPKPSVKPALRASTILVLCTSIAAVNAAMRSAEEGGGEGELRGAAPEGCAKRASQPPTRWRHPRKRLAGCRT